MHLENASKVLEFDVEKGVGTLNMSDMDCSSRFQMLDNSNVYAGCKTSLQRQFELDLKGCLHLERQTEKAGVRNLEDRGGEGEIKIQRRLWMRGKSSDEGKSERSGDEVQK